MQEPSIFNPTAAKIQDLLLKAGLNSRVLEFLDSTRTAQEAADRVGCQLGQIVKSLVFRCQKSGKPILVLTSGANRVDEGRISILAGDQISRADADFVRSVTGFAIGGVPPFGHPEPIRTYMDEDLLQFPIIWAAAGTPNAVFDLSPADLVKFSGAVVIAVK